MSRMGITDRRNLAGMARSRQPVAHNCGDCAPSLPTRAVMRAGLAGDQQDDLQFLGYRLFQRAIQTRIGMGQAGVMQIDADIGNDAAPVDTPVPMSIKILAYLLRRCLR